MRSIQSHGRVVLGTEIVGLARVAFVWPKRVFGFVWIMLLFGDFHVITSYQRGAVSMGRAEEFEHVWPTEPVIIIIVIVAEI